MKTLKTIATCALFSLGYFYSPAQTGLRINEPDYNKPKIFADLPQRMSIAMPDIESLLELPVGSAVMAKLTKTFPFKGTIVSKSGDTNTNVKSVVIKSTTNARPGAVLTLSKIRTDNGNYVYKGRIISKSRF